MMKSCRVQWTSLQPPKLLNGTSGVSLRIGTSLIHVPGSTEHSQAEEVLLPALATGLVQRPVRHGGPSTHWPFSVGSSLPASYRVPGLGHLPTLSMR